MGTPFVPPLPSPDGSPRSPVSKTPSWVHQQPQSASTAGFPGAPQGGPGYNPYASPYGAMPGLPPPAPYMPGSYFAPPMALPGSPAPPGHPGGFPADYAGFGLASAVMGTPYVPPGVGPGSPQGAPPHATPWNPAGMMAPGTGFNAFQQQLPGGMPPAAAQGMPPQWAAMMAHQAAAQAQAQAAAAAAWGQTPWGAPGAFPGMAPPGAPPGPPPPGPQAPGRQQSTNWRDKFAERENTDRVSPWSVGPHYGPVLDPFILSVVKANVLVNPLLETQPESSDNDYLKWNMLWPSSYCSRSCDPPHRSWSKGRSEPATFPRLTSIKIISHSFPWMITIKAADVAIGVTCGDIIDGVDDFLHGMVKKEEFEGASRQRKKDMTSAYHINRSTAHGVPGGRLGEGIRRLDWLVKDTIFAGIARNDAFVRAEYGGLPATLELRCDMRIPLTEKEIQEQEDLERELETERMGEMDARRAHARSRASSRAESRASSRA